MIEPVPDRLDAFNLLGDIKSKHGNGESRIFDLTSNALGLLYCGDLLTEVGRETNFALL